MPDSIIVGSVALDTIKTPFGEAEDVLGGSATYSSFAASFFSKPAIVAVVGEDFPDEFLKFLQQQDIGIEGIEKTGETFRWKGEYEYDMNSVNTISTKLGSFETFDPKIPKEYRNSKYLFLANIHPKLQLSVLKQIHRPDVIMLDSMKLWIETQKDNLLKVISKVDILLLNDSEARQLFGTPNLALAAKAALKLGPKYFIVKKGEHGALLFSKEEHFSAPGYPLEDTKDPTGCGDCFAGGLLGYLASKGKFDRTNLRKAIIYGSVIASFNAEGFGLERLKNISMDDIKARYKEFEKIKEF